MMYLFKDNKPVRTVNMQVQQDNQPSLHPDNLKDIERREEPMVQASRPTPPADRYVPDDTTDPGVTARLGEDANDFPSWIFNEYKLSKTSLWGKPWPDGKEHLIPKQATIAAVIELHNAGQQTIGKMLELAFSSSNTKNTQVLKECWTKMLTEADRSFSFDLMNKLSSLTQTALADRAFFKHSFIQAAGRLKEGEEEPEWFGGMKERMLQAAIRAGTWVHIHSECWKAMEYKDTPKYNNVPNEIRLRLVNNARFLEERYGPEKIERPTLQDQHALAALC